LLPEKALGELSRRGSPRQVLTQLVALQHPYAQALLPLARQAQPNAFELEVALVRACASRSRTAAATSDGDLRGLVGRRIDLCNAELALALAGGPREVDPADCFAPGGAGLGRAAFLEVCGAAKGAPTTLARALASTPLAAVAREAAGSAARLEREGLANELRLQRKAARHDPLGSAPLLLFLLRLQAESADLCRLAWGAALGAPASALALELVTPWS